MMESMGEVLAEIVCQIAPQLQAIPATEAAVKSGPEKWSRKEILGHLIDSAANNHRRFVLACDQADLCFEGYDQEAWVRIQGYQDQHWESLIELWKHYNQHLANVVKRLPREILDRHHTTHTLHQIAWKPVPESEVATLDYLIKDYVGHLEHHVRQILPAYAPVVMGTYEHSS